MSKLLKFAKMAISATVLSGAAVLGSQSGNGWISSPLAIQIAQAEETTTYVDSLIERARSLLAGDSQDVALAVRLLEEATKAGSAEAMLALAELYRTGEGVPKDPGVAKDLLMQVIAAGASGSAYVALGHLYRDASSAEYDPAAAVAAYRNAINLSNTEAMITLGRMLASGDGVPIDFDGAKALFENAIAAGADRGGWAALGALYRDADPPNRDLAKAANALLQAAQLGDPWSMIILARMHASGDGVAKDFDRARDLYESAIAAGAARDGWAGLATLYRNADPPHRNLVEANKALQLAADLGDPWSMIILARMLASGDGMAEDFEQAKSLLVAAAAAGQEEAASETLGDLYWRGSKDRRDPATALHYYKIAARTGSGAANLAAGEIESADYAKDDRRLSMIRHFKMAAKILGPEPVAKAMFGLRPAALTAAVKQMLIEAGEEPGPPDGVFSEETQIAISSFCAAKSLTPCDNAIITLSLLFALLQG